VIQVCSKFVKTLLNYRTCVSIRLCNMEYYFIRFSRLMIFKFTLTNKLFFQNRENNNYCHVYIDKMNNFDHADFNFSLMAARVIKICMDIYRKSEKSRFLNTIERLQIPNILEICYLYNFQWKYVKKYISIQASIFLFVSSVLNVYNQLY
jgi:hypothetical protein